MQISSKGTISARVHAKFENTILASRGNFHKILRTQASIIKDAVEGDANSNDIFRMIHRQKIPLNINLKTNSSQQEERWKYLQSGMAVCWLTF